MGLIEQVATKPCPVCYDLWDVMIEALSGYCDDCQNTQLHWPELSRKCTCPVYLALGERDWVGCLPCVSCLDVGHGKGCECNGSGRIPDVNLEKLLKEISKLGSFQLRCIGGRNGYVDTWWIVLENKEYQDYSEPIPAACVALLGGVE